MYDWEKDLEKLSKTELKIVRYYGGSKDAKEFREEIEDVRKTLLRHENALTQTFHQQTLVRLGKMKVFYCKSCNRKYYASNLPPIRVDREYRDDGLPNIKRYCNCHGLILCSHNLVSLSKCSNGDLRWFTAFLEGTLKKYGTPYENGELYIYSTHEEPWYWYSP